MQTRAQFGRYGALLVIAPVVAVPFVNTVVYEGPMATSLKGADISWIICLAVISPLYYLARLATRRRRPVPRDERDSPTMRTMYLTADGGPG